MGRISPKEVALKLQRRFAYLIRTWCIPPGWLKVAKLVKINLYLLFTGESWEDRLERKYRLKASLVKYDYSKNQKFRNLHAGEELFILCTGPSLKSTDLRPLIGKTCMSVSNFYKHELYSTIRPKYHVTPNVDLANLAKANADPEAALLRWFEEMDQSTGDSRLFFGSRQIDFNAQHDLFRQREVQYLHTNHANHVPDEKNIDISRTICPVQSVPILCLILAIYMGFKKVYLLGVDHDELREQKYEYFFDRKLMAFNDVSVADNNSLRSSHFELLKGFLFLWEQYLGIAAIASKNNIQIINLNPHSFLDVFPKSELALLRNR
jgi:hypothetical protein